MELHSMFVKYSRYHVGNIPMRSISVGLPHKSCHWISYLIVDFTMKSWQLCYCIQCQVYLVAAFQLNFTELLQVLKLNFWERNHNWVFGEQNLKEFLDEWINKKGNFGSFYWVFSCSIIKCKWDKGFKNGPSKIF